MADILMQGMNAYTPHDYADMTERERTIARNAFQAGFDYRESIIEASLMVVIDDTMVNRVLGVLVEYNWDNKEKANNKSRDWYATVAVRPALEAAFGGNFTIKVK